MPAYCRPGPPLHLVERRVDFRGWGDEGWHTSGATANDAEDKGETMMRAGSGRG